MSAKNKYPHFDTLEILLEKEFKFRSYKPLLPVKAGNIIPHFSLSKDFGRIAQFLNGSETHAPFFYNHLLNKPLVIAFYSEHWGQKGVDQLLNLNAFQRQVKMNGGNLLVISPEREGLLEKLAWEHGLSLNFYFDTDNQLARQFRVFDDKSPVWNQFSGVDVNVPLLATYVLDAEKQIVYHHIDWTLSDNFSSDDVLSAVYEAGTYKTNRISA